jgi:hypothetical protein
MRRRLLKCCQIVLLAACAMWISGCLPFPLGNPETSKMDPSLAGYWLAKQDNDKQTLISLYPYDSHTYVMNWTEFTRGDSGQLEPSTVQLQKAWLTSIPNARFITMEPLALRLPSNAQEKKVYVIARLVQDGDGVLVRPIDPDFKGFEEIKNSQDVAQVIKDNLNNPKLYSDNTTHFRHMDPERDRDTLDALLKLCK